MTPYEEKLRELLRRAGLPEAGGRFEALAGDGSDRCFYRIRTGGKSFVALISPRKAGDGIDENDSYGRIGAHLHGLDIPVPKFYHADPASGEFLMEDLGDVYLQTHAVRASVDREKLYVEALRMLAGFHRRAPRGFHDDFCFDTALYDPSFVYARELEYFRNAFLNGCLGLNIAEEDLKPDFEAVAEAAGVTEKRFVIHRDFQSRNIMVHRGRLRLIDFQGARFGPPAYDLASLLVDPYVGLSVEMQKSLVDRYALVAVEFMGCSTAAFRRNFRAVRLARNMQALGAYGYLGVVKGKTRFLQYIPKASRSLLNWLNGPCKGMFPVLRKIVAVADAVPVSPAKPDRS